MQAFGLSGLTCSILCPSSALLKAADLRCLTSASGHMLNNIAAERTRWQRLQRYHEHCMLLNCLLHLACCQRMHWVQGFTGAAPHWWLVHCAGVRDRCAGSVLPRSQKLWQRS